ncbi:MAG: thioredoxin domain-containing protein [Alphaproteobacteria bacterium]
MTSNRLSQETSPYLLQHKDNPVHWQPWGAEAFARARREDRPVLLSIGYAACHWCHVMAHESFEDGATAELLNEGFVSIKVDREERPDVDAIYQASLALIDEHGGWPLTMFLTPEGEPFWGGTYFPSTARFGRPAFPDILRRVLDVYHREPDKVTTNAAAIRAALERLSKPKAGGGLGPDVLERAAARLAQQVDPVHGGLGPAPKFPQPAVLELVWRGWKATGQPQLFDAVTLSLDRMSRGGIYDHLGGGFARYATDRQWLVPHFEKMLYDNAQLVELLCLVWQETQSPLYAARIAETAEWALREMVVDGGGFASSVDADSEGGEGRFYVWSESEIDGLLGPDADAFKEAYDVTPAGNWEGKTILNRSHGAIFADDALEETLARCRAVLWKARETRAKPGRDDKVLADWNGLMIAALANAGAVFATPRWIDSAAAAFAFVRERMSADGRLRHSWRRGEARHPATLDDYAAMSRAALALHEATGERHYLDEAETWVETAGRHFWDEPAGGYFLTADDTEGLITRTKTAFDGPVPSGNGILTGVLARLYHVTGKDQYRARAEKVVTAFSGEASIQFSAMAGLLNGNDLLHNALEVVIVGERAAPDTADLLRALNGVSLPNRVLSMVTPGAELPAGHPAAEKGQIDAKATAYLCRGGTCSAPLTDPSALGEAVATR